MHIAIIVDNFTHTHLSLEDSEISFSVVTDINSLISCSPNLFFVESAWFGFEGFWFNKIKNASSDITDILKYCQLKKIPTVFWCKEDPVHFDQFLLTASQFDYIFTTDINCIPKYKRILGHSNVYLLPFACQPSINNPLESKLRKRAASYAGSFYRRFPHRIYDTYNVLSAVKSILPLDIYDRYLDNPDKNYHFPLEFQPFIVGSLSNADINIAYKEYQYSVNVNTVKNSESMFSRRVFELLGSGTIVISNFSAAFSILFGDIVISSDDPAQIKSKIFKVMQDEYLRAKLALAGVRKVMLEHTYAHRLSRIMGIVFGKSSPPILPSILVAIFVSSSSDALRLFSFLLNQSFQSWRCICVVQADLVFIEINSFALDDRISIILSSNLDDEYLYQLCKNNSWFSLMSVFDYYGPNYLIDLVLATRYSKASAFGKKQFFQVIAGEVVLQGSDGSYLPTMAIDLRSSLISVNHFSKFTTSQFFSDDPISSIEVSDGVALDFLGYCRNVFNQNIISVEQVSTIVDDLEIYQGCNIESLYANANFLRMDMPFWLGKPGWRPEKLAHIFGDRFTRDITGSIDRFGWHIISDLPDGDSCVLFSEFSIPVDDLGGKSGTPFYLEVGVGLQMQFLFRFESAAGTLIEETIFEVNVQNQLVPPNFCTHIRLGYLITSSGSSRINRLALI